MLLQLSLAREVAHKDINALRQRYLGSFTSYYELASKYAFPVHNQNLHPIPRRHPKVRAGEDDMSGFSFEDYPFLDPEYNKQISPATAEEIAEYPFLAPDAIPGIIGPTETYWTDMFLYFFDDPVVQDAAFMAFFHEMSAERSNDTTCYRQFVRANSLYQQFATNQNARWENFFQQGWFQWIQDGFDLNLEFFQFYEDCNFEHFMVSMAIRWTTLKGFLSQVINITFILLQILSDDKWQRQIIILINSANFTGELVYWQQLGMQLGAVVSQLFDYKVPSYEYVYGQSTLRELTAKSVNNGLISADQLVTK